MFRKVSPQGERASVLTFPLINMMHFDCCCCCCCGSGLTNTVTAVKNAQMAESPVLLLGGAAATLLKVRHTHTIICRILTQIK